MYVYLKYWPTLVGFCWFLRCISRMWPPKREKKRHQNKNKKTNTQQMASIYKFLFVYILWLIFAFFWAVFLVWLNFQCFFFCGRFCFCIFFITFVNFVLAEKQKHAPICRSIRPSVRFPFWPGCLSVRPFVLLANYLLH